MWMMEMQIKWKYDYRWSLFTSSPLACGLSMFALCLPDINCFSSGVAACKEWQKWRKENLFVRCTRQTDHTLVLTTLFLLKMLLLSACNLRWQVSWQAQVWWSLHTEKNPKQNYCGQEKCFTLQISNDCFFHKPALAALAGNWERSVCPKELEIEKGMFALRISKKLSDN